MLLLCADGEIHLLEDKVFAAFDRFGFRDPKRWVLDTGASNHMYGSPAAFSNIAQPVCLAARGEEEAWVWHAQFIHLNFGAMRKMGRNGLVRGMPTLTQGGACLAGKQRRASFPQHA